MKVVIIILFTFCITFVTAQELSKNTFIKVYLTAGEEPLRGASFYLEKLNTSVAGLTDINGLATISVPENVKKIEISVMGPYISLKIIHPVDSVYFDINSKYATYFYQGKKVKRKKQIVKGY